jgi:chromosome segregation ATPase
VEDKIFELLEKMYVDIKGELNDIKTELSKKADKTDIVRIENEHGQKLDALFDDYKQLHEKQEEHDKRFDRIETKLDNLSIRVNSHDSKLEVLEGGRKK